MHLTPEPSSAYQNIYVLKYKLENFFIEYPDPHDFFFFSSLYSSLSEKKLGI